MKPISVMLAYLILGLLMLALVSLPALLARAT